MSPGLDRVHVELAVTRVDADFCHPAVDSSPFLLTGLSTHR
ncbi:hypothetical protein SynA1560_01350 [Synechococcus sp. A15-60]|nr:hypothetical protein SynA1560_01350 [Synechococcus sp. A15-60]